MKTQHISQTSRKPILTFAPEKTAPRGDILVVVFLRGAADVLNMVVPHGEDEYYNLRPALGIPRPDDSKTKVEERAIDLDGFFGFHPLFKPLLPAWQEGHLGIVHACGAPDDSHSHFKSQELMERGVENEQGPASGWIGRHLATLNTNNPSPMRAIALGELPQRSLYGSTPVSSLRSIEDFQLHGNETAVLQMQAALSSLYSGDDLLSGLGRETLGILDTLEKIKPIAPNPQSPNYPDSTFGHGLREIASIIKAEIGLEVAAIDLDGWDTHFAQGVQSGQMPRLMQNLADGLAAFHAEMIDHADKLTVVVMTEFGRRAYENASLGTDHGHGGMMMLVSGKLKSTGVFGEWPGLAPHQLYGPGDLAVTTDYRDILGEICMKRLNNPAVERIFPNYAVNMSGYFL
ncbi:MAG: DUF1501 domain-containing protein [Anaerolineae bacterium]|jgi:uncharacterized protein (DUF1501 family)|nr:DUF1501 domain-containing protein [Anaerolineae bacterium]MBT3711777.1 DUF1501 domain-containing protein [Anaerolineae bacterium]MBT4311200.1 DUF1501 domain-containing protein [Anaerolineae bacterium]MBT4458158.1 DUF1501 domain-containing protein [Anaerolineae bacterium]MBT6061812.1 DUF1501 domain-containing protein [Anaerolineae bacterium]